MLNKRLKGESQSKRPCILKGLSSQHSLNKIAKKANCSASYVRVVKFRAKHDSHNASIGLGPNAKMPWFKAILCALSAVALYGICSNDAPISVLERVATEALARPIRRLPDDELQRHTFVNHETHSRGVSEARRTVKRCFTYHRLEKKPAYQGFILFNLRTTEIPQIVPAAGRVEWERVFHDELPAILRRDEFRRAFDRNPIFQKMKGSDNERRGDGRRRQLKLSHIRQIAADQLEKAKKGASRKHKPAICADRLDEARRVLRVVDQAIDLIEEHYKNLAQLCPFKDIPRTLDSHDFASVLDSLPSADMQGIHADDYVEGWSLLTPLEYEQELVILLNGYTLCSIIHECSKDLDDAVEEARKKLAAGGHVWDDCFRDTLWAYLIEEHLKQRFNGSIPELEAVRVRIPVGCTLAVDSFTPHGGAQGGKSGGMRLHEYCMRRCGRRGEAAELNTMNLCSLENVMFPLICRAQSQGRAVFRT
jgi:hypothetical protein